jgi:hypothetical protein
MFRDPDLIWAGEFPYDKFEQAGVTMDSSIDEVQDADEYFTSQSQNLVSDTREAMKALSTVQNRLFVDFFLYRLPYPIEDE